jgi:lipopolysaccharide transport system permease protein
MKVTVIEAQRRFFDLRLREAWQRRELLRVFVWRAIAARYRQMALGILWSVFEPLALLAMTTVVFGLLLRAPTNGYPYPVFAFAGLLPWTLFSRATLAAAGSLVENIALISKVYFPRLLLPVAAVVREAVDVGVTLVLMLGFAWAYGFPPNAKLLVLPVVLAFALAFALGIGLWAASVMVRFRDLRPVLTIALQAGLYASPILYSPSVVPAVLRPVYEANPMYWAIQASRWVLLGQPFEPTPGLAVALALVLVLFVSGLYVFSFLERSTVDVQ